ncbi:MAG: F0F1 ATP synthase subunit A [Mariniphaga sp.]|nr:F0F1 ATP synthase subunit A [Mariniphaga sp.]
MLRFVKVALIFLALLVVNFTHISAQPHVEESDHNSDERAEQAEHITDNHADEKFDAGKYVIEHVSDAYDWHITTIGDKHISVPLPVILYSKNPELHGGRSLVVFMSSKFHHANNDYKGYRISHSEEYEGKIVELDSHGTEIGKPIDLSMTKTVAGALVAALVILWLFLSVARSTRRNTGKAPRGLQNLVEPIIIFIRDEVAKQAIGDKKYEKFMPFLLSLFFFILINNFIGLIPIFPFGANVTGNISVTLALALFTFILTAINGNKHYWKEIYNPEVPWWLKFPIPLMLIVELSGVITKPFVLMMRLFANMLAGHLIVMVFVSLIFIFSSTMGAVAGAAISPVSVAFSVFILLLDILVSFIQAYVFTLLSALYFGMATAEHH